MIFAIVINDIFTWLKYNFWWLLILIVLIIVLIMLIRLTKASKETSKKPLEDEKINAFIDCYGGIENINKIELDGSRLKVSIKNIDKVNINEFKALGATGIFISGNNIKMVLPYDMDKLVKKINDDKYGGKV
ncbi:MAG: PTS transporter subunit EIIB [Candidatus Izimaplasma sp.]|nr:PTS transporter subunit EIIB [Candidatus Izimaplasma bacterium]